MVFTPDAAFMPLSGRPLRSDLSCTVFIGSADAYEGGELAVHLGTRQVLIKGEVAPPWSIPLTLFTRSSR